MSSAAASSSRPASWRERADAELEGGVVTAAAPSRSGTRSANDYTLNLNSTTSPSCMT
jgi:hypothetical protein